MSFYYLDVVDEYFCNIFVLVVVTGAAAAVVAIPL